MAYERYKVFHMNFNGSNTNDNELAPNGTNFPSLSHNSMPSAANVTDLNFNMNSGVSHSQVPSLNQKLENIHMFIV